LTEHPQQTAFNEKEPDKKGAPFLQGLHHPNKDEEELKRESTFRKKHQEKVLLGETKACDNRSIQGKMRKRDSKIK
jgi:hypothetical protein